MSGSITIRPASIILACVSLFAAINDAIGGDWYTAWLFLVIALLACDVSFTITPAPTGEKE